jgi:CHASE2 domain-containing sensor protein
MPVDEDGFVRRFFLLPPQGSPMLPFPVAQATNFTRQPLTAGPRRTQAHGSILLHQDRMGLNTALIGTWSRQPARAVSALDVIKPGFDRRVFEGKIVLVGQSNVAAGDRHFTPLFRVKGPDGKRLMMAGTEIMAAAISTALGGKTVRVLAPPAQWAITGAIVFISLILLLSVRAGLARSVSGAGRRHLRPCAVPLLPGTHVAPVHQHGDGAGARVADRLRLPFRPRAPAEVGR